jgi:hypothetical protein
MYDFPHLRDQCDYGEMEEIQSLDVFVDMSHMMNHMVHSSITSIISTLLLVLEPMAAYRSDGLYEASTALVLIVPSNAVYCTQSAN